MAVRLYQVNIRKCRLGILIQSFHVRMCRRAVQVEIIFLYILAMISLTVCQAKIAFLQNRIPPVPECKGKAESLPVVRYSCNAVFTPTVSTRPRMIMRKEIPGIAIFTVIFPHGSPLAFAQVWPPFFPCDFVFPGLH